MVLFATADPQMKRLFSISPSERVGALDFPGPITANAISARKCYVIGTMTKPARSETAKRIHLLAQRYHIAYAETPTDRLAHHITRLAGDIVELDEVERLLIGLQRAGHLSRAEMIQLQAQYLREAKP